MSECSQCGQYDYTTSEVVDDKCVELCPACLADLDLMPGEAR